MKKSVLFFLVCFLIHSSQASHLFEFDESLAQETPQIHQAIGEIEQNLVGHRLIQKIGENLTTYNQTLTTELIKKSKIDKEDECQALEVLEGYNRVFLSKQCKTLFSCPKAIPQQDFWGVQNLSSSYSPYFQLRIEINPEDFDGKPISVLYEGRQETEQAQTTFTRILFHELVHVADFLFDSRTYRDNNRQFNWKPSMNILWPFLSNKYDGLKLEESWDGRMTEVKAVIGEEFDKQNTDINYIGRFSELSFAVVQGEPIRLPYKMCDMVVHGETSQFLFDNARKHIQIMETL